MLKLRRNVKMVFTVGLRSMLAEFLLTNLIEPLRGLERASRPALKGDKLLTKKAIKNLKCNKCKREKHSAKSSAPKLATLTNLRARQNNIEEGFSIEVDLHGNAP